MRRITNATVKIDGKKVCHKKERGKSMNDLTVFNNPEFGEIRTVTKDGEPMFCLSDVCKALGLEQVSRVKSRLKEDGVIINKVIDRLGREQEATFINELNLYKTIFQSRKESAERFTDWVAGEVLPSIRKTGSYTAHQETCASEQLDSASVIQIAKILSHAPADRLPMIVDFFRRSGIDMELIKPLQEPEKKSGRIQNLEEFLEGLEELAEFSHGEYRVLTNVFNDYCEERGESSRMARKMLAEKGLLRISVTSDGRQHYTISMRIPGENRVTRCVCIKPGWREYLE